MTDFFVDVARWVRKLPLQKKVDGECLKKWPISSNFVDGSSFRELVKDIKGSAKKIEHPIFGISGGKNGLAFQEWAQLCRIAFFTVRSAESAL
ncbi:hypothetical protein [Bartonella sp. CB178]|uniref:hypothetical protein n=1 Tax=Bartonella sp. CB178 TaxID=3112255 RepID=UPI00300DCB09